METTNATHTDRLRHEAGRRDAGIDEPTGQHYQDVDPEGWDLEGKAFRNGYNERWNEG